MSELPDFKKIEFPSTPAIPLEDILPDASPEVTHSHVQIVFSLEGIIGTIGKRAFNLPRMSFV